MDNKLQENIAQFCGVTGASTRDAKRFLQKYKRVDVAIDAFYNDSSSFSTSSSKSPSNTVLSKFFDKYKDPDGDEITVDGTIKLCEDLGVDLEDVVMLAIAYELRSPRMGLWSRQGWVDGWKKLGCDSLESMQGIIPRLRDRLGSDSDYFQKVYNYTFDFSRNEGQRSLALETAQALWALLLPHGLKGGALAHIPSQDADEDIQMSEKGWKDEYTQWWFDFLNERSKGVSKDTWQMFLDFVRVIDSQFANYDAESAWPSTIDDFVDYAKKRLAS